MPRPRLPLLGLLIAVATSVTAVLGFGSYRLITQQRDIDRSHASERLANRADALAADIRGKLAETGDLLNGWLVHQSPSVPRVDDGLVFAVSDGQVVAHRGLPFVPIRATASDAVARIVSPIEAAEFRGATAAAVAAYQPLTRDADPRIQASAWMRLGRIARHQHDGTAALAAYGQVAGLGETDVDGYPASLAALDGQRSTLRMLQRSDAAAAVEMQMVAGLDAGQWLVTRGQADYLRDTLTSASRGESWQLADAVSRLWEEWAGHPPERGVRVITSGDRAVLLMWRANSDAVITLAVPPERFLPAAVPGEVFDIVATDGVRIAGEPLVAPQSITRIVGDAQSPWTLRLAAPTTEAQGVRTSVMAMLAGMLLFLWIAVYLMARALRREAAVAQLQSDFVAAVSHEFRSPLTTVRQLGEMLEMGQVQSEPRRQQYYELIAAEARRLQHLVETLLNFGRMEAGAERYRHDAIDLADVVRSVASEFAPRAAHAGIQLECVDGDASAPLSGDRDAITLAIRNLVDNAIKYSPAGTTIRVACASSAESVSVSVSDQGAGIDPSEHHAIFRKFVRGRAALAGRIRGTGIGLAMVRHIVDAHGGDVRVDSEPDRGSTFTMSFPSAAEPSVAASDSVLLTSKF